MTISPFILDEKKAYLNISYKVNKDRNVIQYKNQPISYESPFSNKDVVVEIGSKPHSVGHCLDVSVTSTKNIELVTFEIVYLIDLSNQHMLANGFQSWSQTREFTKNDKIPGIRSTVAWYTKLNLQGDYDIFEYSGEKGLIHSNSYTHLRDLNNKITFFGSISEHLGYTYFKGDFNKNTLSILKDVLGKEMAPDQTLELIQIFSSQDATHTWQTYRDFYPDRCATQNTHISGWTSWYNYYGDVTEAILRENIEALKPYPIDIFQIDDGYQTAIGDWLSISRKFPSGMSAIAKTIREAGFKAGLWLAPFAVAFSSRLAKDHPQWLVIDPESRKPLVAGPNWGGFYALDMYHPEARRYLKTVFDTILKDWGYDMLKLDFCFAAAMIPRKGKSRGEIMWEAMDFIRDLVGPDKLILGCGVPLASAFRKVDYCRVGSDVAPWWEDPKLKLLHVRERVSTVNSLTSTLSRWNMSNWMFGNDPDVIILRNLKNKLTLDERYSLCVINNILGALVFTSDNVSLYGKDEHLLYAATFPKVVPEVYSVVEVERNCYVATFDIIDPGNLKRTYTTCVNLTDSEQSFDLPSQSDETHLLFATHFSLHTSQNNASEPIFYHPSSTTKLKKHETKTFMHIPRPKMSPKWLFLGSNSHIVPGTELEAIDANENEIHVKFSKNSIRQHKVYFAYGLFLYQQRPDKIPWTKINGQEAKFEWLTVSGKEKPKGEVLAYIFEDEALL